MKRFETESIDRTQRISAKATTAYLSGGVLSVRISGALTASALLDIKREVMGFSSVGVKAFLADYRAAIVAMDGSGLDAVLAGESPGAGASLPAAMVVSIEHADLFIGHARRMASWGCSRRVFLELSPALHWARDQALLPGG